MSGMSSKTSSKKSRPSKTNACWCNDVSTMGTVRWYIHRVECGQQDHHTGRTHLVHSGCRVLVLWLSMTPVLYFTNCIHNHSTPLTYPRRKANTTVEQLRKGNPCHAVLVILRKKISSKNKNAGKKHGLSRLTSTFLFVYDPIVLFCFRNSSLIIR